MTKKIYFELFVALIGIPFCLYGDIWAYLPLLILAAGKLFYGRKIIPDERDMLLNYKANSNIAFFALLIGMSLTKRFETIKEYFPNFDQDGIFLLCVYLFILVRSGNLLWLYKKC